MGNQQTDKVVQSLFFQQAFIMQIGDEGDAETFKSFGNIPVSEIIFHDTVDTCISG